MPQHRVTAMRAVAPRPDDGFLSWEPPDDDIDETADTGSRQQQGPQQRCVQLPGPLIRSFGLRGRLSRLLISSALMNCSSGSSVGASITTRPSL